MLNDIYQMLDPVALSLGPLQIRWYGIAYLLGFVCAGAVVYRYAKRWKVPFDIYDLTVFICCCAFGIVIGAMSGQVAIAIARYFEMGGISGLLFCFTVAFFAAALCGYFTGKLYNKTRGQEMIASLIVGYFANGIYQFLFLFVVGMVIAVPATHPMIKPDGIGIRMTVDEQEVTWLEAWDLGRALFETMPALEALSAHPVAACGARGCILGCMKHVEKTGTVENTFHTRPVFSEEKPWRLDDEPGHRFADHKGLVWHPDNAEPEASEPREDEGWY